MTHETMLAWLDKANSGAIQSASDRLLSAATEIRKIAEDLKVRPQMVEWKGEGATAFRTWGADLANATLRLGDYSEGASKWLAQASDALASAQVAIPRTDAGAKANLEAAKAAHNDPDASAVEKKSLETLLAAKESNRQEAAAEMRRLAQSYQFSASQMDGLERPVFPPPPGEFVPDREDRELNVSGSRDFTSNTPGGVPSGHASTGSVGGVDSPKDAQTASRLATDPSRGAETPVRRPVDMEIAGAVALPDTPTVSPVAPPVTAGGGKVDGLTALGPLASGGTVLPTNPTGGRGLGGVRGPLSSGASVGSIPPGRPARDSGIVGGRPVSQSVGRPTGGLPRGNVIGGEGMHSGRPSMGHGGSGGAPSTQGGIVGGRRLAGETGGMVGGRPQQPGRSLGRPFTPGGTGLVRGAAGEGVRGTGAVGRGSGGNPQRPGESRREDRERPDYLVEDEETWQQGGRQVVPPVID
ncbi:WXG100 family type VII secretion target [Streptomyces sp. NPDC086010]|uniref:WXG100 family type VII secretion target n=1 Tax=Streptomyces sp. NPDC086010 TaxID=3365745 RepID=UPI0037D216F9